MTIEWTDALSVGHSVVDDQHRTLIGLLNDLMAAVAQALEDESVGSQLVLSRAADFFACFKDHSQKEEALMHQLFYSRVEYHARHHELFISALRTLLLDDPNLDAIRINLPFIQSAVIDHLERDDRDFGDHLRRLGLFGKL
jgi:hemerythrin